VITSKSVTGGPQYTLVIRDWKTDAVITPDSFVFKVPSGAKQVQLDDLKDIDELPAGTVKGAEQ
jgi:hypothetical protein